jgi:hypothetical protein
MMVWPDGGIGRPHTHPYWSKCPYCAAGPGWAQDLVHFLVLLIIPMSVLLLVYFVLKGMAGQ